MFTEANMCLRVDVQTAVHTLPGDQRDSVLLVLVHGLTVREAAAVLGTSRNSLHRSLELGVRRLRHRLRLYS